MTKADKDTRGIVARAFTWVEDIVYVGLGLLLAISALLLLGSGAVAFARAVSDGQLAAAVISLLDRLLLTLMIVELLYTVQVSFREHTLVPEPFLLVGLVAATRRILVLTAELGDAKAERERWELRVALLKSDKLDPDMLDERARALLGFADPHDVVMLRKQP